MTNWHIVTCEYPPQIGGVSDYARLLARELRHTGDEVHVWAPGLELPHSPEETDVHRVLGDFSFSELNTAGAMLDRYPQPRRLLLQWVPHGYGKRGMNFGFARWIVARVRQGERLDLMVHEPFLERRQPSWKLRVVSFAQRRMMRSLLRHAQRVFVSIPAWENYLRPYAPPALRCQWLPIPATVELDSNPPATAAIRARFPPDAIIIGHLGTYSSELVAMLRPALLKTLELTPNAHALLLGAHSDRFAGDLQAHAPGFAARIQGVGLLADAALSHHLSACDLALQPYLDGLSSRRTSLMNVISHGIAVVSNVGHLTESLWAESNAIALASTGDATQLSSLCSDLLRDHTRRLRLAQTGRALYLSRFDWPNIISTLRGSPEAARTQASEYN
jgi:glycosyltransferase involved in cell wall biosynthesis